MGKKLEAENWERTKWSNMDKYIWISLSNIGSLPLNNIREPPN